METKPPPEATPQGPTSPAKGDPGLRELAGKVASAHAPGPAGIPKPGAPPGKKRPRGGRGTDEEIVARFMASRNLRAVPLEQAGGDPGGYQARAVVTPQFVEEISEKLLKGLESWMQRRTYRLAVRIGADKVLAREIATDDGAPPGMIPVMAASLAECSQKYPWLAEWTPEGALVACSLTWASAHLATTSRLRAIAAEMKEARESVKTSPEASN